MDCTSLKEARFVEEKGMEIWGEVDVSVID